MAEEECKKSLPGILRKFSCIAVLVLLTAPVTNNRSRRWGWPGQPALSSAHPKLTFHVSFRLTEESAGMQFSRERRCLWLLMESSERLSKDSLDS